MEQNLVSIVKDKMIEYYAGDSRRVHHFLKVHSFAKLIAELENMQPDELEVLEIAALTHDIGIKNAELKYGYNNGRLQEQEGPPEARRLLREAGAGEASVERACYLVAHHHTYRNIDGLDYQILVEADFLVNMYEDKADADTIRKAYDNIFATETGKRLCRQLFSLEC
mgnify:CR=1 FL=1|jgi:uncharacterized protein